MIDYIVSRLTPIYSPEEAREIAFWVLEELTGQDRFTLSACKDTKNISNIEIILERIIKKEPIQYIFGHILWSGLDLKLTSATLIPRPETAELVDWINNSLNSKLLNQTATLNSKLSTLNCLDIGTGSGCIALSLKQRHPAWQVTGIDISPEAIAIARENATRNHLDVRFIEQDILSLNSQLLNQPATLHSTLSTLNYDIVVSNPPYVLESEKVSMESNVLDYEPSSALFVPNDDPLLFYRRIAELRLGRWLYFEINERFGAEVCDLLSSLGYIDIELKRDSYGKERFVRARLAH
ncbi:MAG: peptide chain release factor N(5)-glutamine methyltransferase [Paludibacteraceae bacterium]|nr:peptide chain release factor N(5)-glutamine methyltransferase [Paludibacteraceae bacterium]